MPIARTRTSLLVLALALAGCEASGPGNDAAAEADSNAATYGNDVYATYGVHNPPDASPCQSPNCSYADQPGRPADPSYPPYWQSRWTMYTVSAGYETNPPPYNGKPPAGTTYETSWGASYYDSTWRGKSGEGAMMEFYEKRCLPIFPFIPNNFTCAFISLGDTAYFLTFPQDRPKGMPPVCLFSPLNHPPRRDFIKHLPWSKGDSERLGPGAQGYSFWINGNPGPEAGKIMQVGASPDGTEKGWILFGYAFAPVNGKMQPQSFYFSGFPLNSARSPDRQPELYQLGADPAGPGQDLEPRRRPRPRQASRLHGHGRPDQRKRRAPEGDRPAPADLVRPRQDPQAEAGLNRHCEERSDEAIQRAQAPHWIASLRSQ